MFEGLRKRLSDAVKGFVKKEEKIVEREQVAEPSENKVETDKSEKESMKEEAKEEEEEYTEGVEEEVPEKGRA